MLSSTAAPILTRPKGYGSGHNKTLLGEVLKPVRHEVVIATKLRTQTATSDNTT